MWIRSRDHQKRRFSLFPTISFHRLQNCFFFLFRVLDKLPGLGLRVDIILRFHSYLTIVLINVVINCPFHVV